MARRVWVVSSVLAAENLTRRGPGTGAVPDGSRSGIRLRLRRRHHRDVEAAMVGGTVPETTPPDGGEEVVPAAGQAVTGAEPEHVGIVAVPDAVLRSGRDGHRWG